MYAEVRLLKQVIAMFGRYWAVLPICCLLLFPVRCDASPFPHSVFVSPAGAVHSGHAHGATAGNSQSDPIQHLHHHDAEDAERCRVLATESEEIGTDVESMSKIASSIDGFQAASVPNLNDLLSVDLVRSPDVASDCDPLDGEHPYPPAPPPRTLDRR